MGGGGQAALQPSLPSGLAACVLVRLGQLNWRLLLMLNIAGCNNETSSIFAGLCTWCVCVSPPATPASTITAQLAETRGAAISSSLGHEPTSAGARKTSMSFGLLFLILYIFVAARRVQERLDLISVRKDAFVDDTHTLMAETGRGRWLTSSSLKSIIYDSNTTAPQSGQTSVCHRLNKTASS